METDSGVNVPGLWTPRSLKVLLLYKNFSQSIIWTKIYAKTEVNC